MSEYKVLITTAGVGSRLGNLTKYTNKSLVRLGDKPIISYIIESYPKDVEFVVSVGYFAEHVVEFLKLAYPKRRFKFVMVDKFEGAGSSMGYSLLKAKKYLQCPFIIHTGDTVVLELIPKPEYNWNGGFRGKNSTIYRTFSTFGNEIKKIYNKGVLNSEYIQIGLTGIYDYKKFWEILENLYNKFPNKTGLCECQVLNKMIKKGNVVKFKEFFNWYDTGNVTSLTEARLKIPSTVEILDKSEESIFIFNKFVIKFFYDKNIVKKRILRAKELGRLIPNIEKYGKNFYKYKYVKGKLLSKIITEKDFDKFLKWSNTNLWKPVSEVKSENFKKICYDFYYKKTKERLKKFKLITTIRDVISCINGQEIPSVKKMLKLIDFNWLCESNPMSFHGDFILDNILKTKNGYCLLDWRQDFGGLIKSGDIYYDLAKLNHNLTINHEIVLKNLFLIEIDDKNRVKCDILRKENLVQCQNIFFEFIKKEGFDFRKIQILTAIIWLNMSPLHGYPFNVFLYYFGKLNLWRAINLK